MPPEPNLTPARAKSKQQSRSGRASAVLAALAAAALFAGALWDAARLLGHDTAPRVSSALVAGGIALGCLAVLLRVLGRTGRRVRNALELVALGLALLAWYLRGHPDIPADPPLVVAELFAALVLTAGVVLPARPVA